MRILQTLLSVTLIFFTLSLTAQTPSAQEILDKSINYHDPNGALETQEIHLHLNEPRPDGSERKSVLVSNLQKEYFKITRKTGEHKTVMIQDKETFTGSLDGKSELTDEEIEKHKITAKRLDLLKNYYQYLWFLPCKLKDPGTIIDEKVVETDFFEKNGYQLKVTYSPEVGKDTWYFYFDKSTFALIGYRFYHDESKNDGEYILIEGEVEGNGIRIPAVRKWYKHQKDEYLGEDILEKIEVVKG